MSSIFAKLNLKSETEVLVVNAPPGFERFMRRWPRPPMSRDTVAGIHSDWTAGKGHG